MHATVESNMADLTEQTQVMSPPSLGDLSPEILMLIFEEVCRDCSKLCHY
jgi:hypothetical protein